MKLQELAASPTKQAAKVFESYFGGRVQLDNISGRQVRGLLHRVRGLIKEHRGTQEFHHSEKNPTYLKLIMMESVLSAKMREDDGGGATVPLATPAGAAPAPKPGTTQTAALQTAQVQQKKREIQDQIKIKQKEIADLQQAMNNPTMMATMENRSRHSRLYRRLAESEIQQAQVVLAAQDMVDRVQKMLEDVTSMQFKDLPALVDQVKNEVGIEQSAQFNTDANAALGGLVQNLQASKQQLEQALGVVTGQAGATPPAMDAVGGMAPDMGEPAPVPDAGNDDLETDLSIANNTKAPPSALGRGRR
jgi:hypothetical protein